MMCSFSSGGGAILYSQQSGFFLFRSKVSDMSGALWENMGLQGCVCLDNRSHVLQDTRSFWCTRLQQQHQALQLAREHSPLSMRPWCTNILPPWAAPSLRVVFGTGETGVLTSAADGPLILFPALSSVAELSPEGPFCHCSWRIYNLWVSNL